jgi:ABC-type spermidine/putrescine transport system permease subunit I
MKLLRASIAILLPALLLVVGGTAAGAILTVRMSLHAPGAGAGLFEPGSVSLSSWASMGDAHHRGIVLTTILTGLGVSLLSTSIGALLALLAAPFAGLRFMGVMVLILAPRLSGVLASLFGLQRLLPRGWIGSLIAETWLLVPYSTLILVIALRGIDPHLVPAARGLGASRRQVLRWIIWPLSLPAVALTLQLGWVWGLGAFLGPLFLGGPDQSTLAVEIHHEAFDLGRWPRAAAEGVVLMVLTASAMAAGSWRPRP